MFNLSMWLWLFVSLPRQNCVDKPFNLDSLFVRWNKATTESLQRQIQLSTDTLNKNRYRNRLTALKAYIDVSDMRMTNVNSIRYQFLKELFQKNKIKRSDFYVVEANESGVKVDLKCFVVNIDSQNTSKVEFYIFTDKWKKLGEAKLLNNKIKNLKNCISVHGFNYQDIIVTRFINSDVNESEYFLSRTLSPDCGIKNILDSFKE